MVSHKPPARVFLTRKITLTPPLKPLRALLFLYIHIII